MIQKFLRFVPPYTWIPITLALVFNLLVYYCPNRFFALTAPSVDVATPIDGQLPFLSFFVLIYVLAYVQWAGSYIWHGRDSVKLCYHIVTADCIAKLLCLIIFLAMPTQTVHPVISDNTVFDHGMRMIFAVDRPINLFPSIHCLESWICFRGAMMLSKKNGWYIAAQGVFTLLVFASTLFTKQHLILDIPAGILVGEIGLFLSKKFNLWRFMNKLQPRKIRPDITVVG